MKIRHTKQLFFKVITGRDAALDYKPGLLKDTRKWHEYSGSGIYFTNIQHIFAYLDYGDFVSNVTIPKYAKMIEDGETMSNSSPYIIGWKANKIILSDFLNLHNIETIKYLVSLGADVCCDDFHVYRWAITNNHQNILDYLQSVKKVTIVYEQVI